MISFVMGSVGSLIKLQLSGEFQLTSSDLELAFLRVGTVSKNNNKT
jgi:hypothetical protein